MYTRIPPKANTTRLQSDLPPDIRLPKNYSGNAFTSDGHKAPLSLVREDIPLSVEAEKKQHLSPSISPIIPRAEEPISPKRIPEPETVSREIAPAVELHDRSRDTRPLGSLFSSVLPNGIFKNNFPFGHGIGEEELLILGIMLSVYMSGEEHGDLLILLAILLFAG